MTTMKAVRIHAYGGPEVLRYEDAPKPTPAAGDVLVRVHAAGINPVDYKIRQGHMQSFIPLKLPAILGWDLSGVVEELGPGVSGFAVGDAVYGRPDILRDGAYAEYIAVRAAEIAPKPASLDHIHAASVPLAALTAWQSLFEAMGPSEAAGLSAGQTVLVHAAAGGVGTFAVQLAKWKGARVIGTGSAGNAEFLRELGVDTFIDYNVTRFENVVHDVDVVYDTIGGETQERSWGVLRKGGILVSITGQPSAERARAHGVRASSIRLQPNAAQLKELSRLIDAGTVRPIIAKVLPLSATREAHELSQTGHTRGKIVLKVVD
jgi:NADPH:quinone reductase-like Zn-dependent oxidoreductase